jgi:SAM-dependent methyltransferase
MTAPRGRFRATLARSIRLLREFRYEQPDPARFYTALAQDSAAQLASYVDLRGAVLLDVGGGPGYFRDAFRAAGATYWALDSDVGELSGLGGIAAGTVIGSGMELPFRDGAVDVCYSSNVLEHVPDPWRMADEMVRVTRPGGTVFLSYTVWYGPWGGHETAPWHFLGGARARRRYARKHGHEPKNRYGESLFRVTVRDGIAWTRTQTAADVVAVLPRYNPWWSNWLVRVPVLREVVTWNLVVVLSKR